MDGEMSEHAEGAYADERHQMDRSGFDPDTSYETDEVEVPELNALAEEILDEAGELDLAIKATYLVQEFGEHGLGYVTDENGRAPAYRLGGMGYSSNPTIIQPRPGEHPDRVEILVNGNHDPEPFYRVVNGEGRELRDVDFDYEAMIEEEFRDKVEAQVNAARDSLQSLLSLSDR